MKISIQIAHQNNIARFGTMLQIIILLFSFVLLGCSQKNNKNESGESRLKQGEALFQSSNCIMCHSLDGQELYGPTLHNILNKEVKVIRNKTELSLTVDRDYIYRAIAEPDYEKVKGFESRKMPVPTLSKKQMEALTEYLIFVNEKE